MTRSLLLIILSYALAGCSNQELQGPASYVDPFIGTEGGGNVFPGASLPFGMVKLGSDCGDKGSNSGYYPDSLIHGFSHTHVSGTGGGPKYGNIMLTPFVGNMGAGDLSSKPEYYQASPGYFSVHLQKHGIDVELSVSHSVGFHSYTFPKNSLKGIIVDAGSFLGPEACCGEKQEFEGSDIKILSNSKLEGYSRIRGGWNKGDAYTVYFAAEFDTPSSSSGRSADRTNAYFKFDEKTTEQIKVKVGISFISTDKAWDNIREEIDHWNFEKVRNTAVKKWNDLLGRISVEDENEDRKKIFYTALYHAALMPTDRSGENPLWESTAPYYDDFYAIWDTYRATHPLYMFLCPDRQRDIVSSLIDIYKHEGYMPVARSGNFTGRTQGGSNCDVLIADAYMKGIQGIDYEKGLESMIKNAEVSPGEKHQWKGRGGLEDYNTLGYVSTQHERAGSRTVEYAYNDYCIYMLAKGLGKDSIAQKYLQSSNNWKNLWKQVEDSGAKGFIMPRAADGNWDEDFMGRTWDPIRDWIPSEFTVHTGGTWSDFFYEADSWEYSFYVPHDVPGLIAACGGKDAFIARLDTFFARDYFSVSNEPSFLTPCLYNYAGRQDRSSEVVREIIAKNYKTTADGIPGNDDSGSMSAWVAFHLLGFYPNAGQDIYLITAPHFKDVSIEFGDNKTLSIIAYELSDTNVYIKKVLLNGKELKRSWFRHSEIADGGVIEFFMTEEATNEWEMDNP